MNSVALYNNRFLDFLATVFSLDNNNEFKSYRETYGMRLYFQLLGNNWEINRNFDGLIFLFEIPVHKYKNKKKLRLVNNRTRYLIFSL